MRYGYCKRCNFKIDLDSNNGIHCSSCLNHFHVEESKYKLKHALANALNMLKGFEVGYTSLTNESIVIEHQDEVFVLKFEHKENLTLEGAVDELC